MLMCFTEDRLDTFDQGGIQSLEPHSLTESRYRFDKDINQRDNYVVKQRKTLNEKYPPFEPCSCEVCLGYCIRPGW